MIDVAGLRSRRDRRFFEGWDGFVEADQVAASEDCLRGLVDEILAMGPEVDETAVRAAVARCVERFNALDDGWLCTIERDDIFVQVGEIVDLCGFEYDEDWLAGRDW